jgi:hypothetical protein
MAKNDGMPVSGFPDYEPGQFLIAVFYEQVAWLLLLDTLNTVFDIGFVYRYTITLFGKAGREV